MKTIRSRTDNETQVKITQNTLNHVKKQKKNNGRKKTTTYGKLKLSK